MIEFFLKLLLVHLLTDFVFQPTKWVSGKETKKVRSKYLYLHIGVYALLLSLVLPLASVYVGSIVILLASHLLIDVSKSYIQNDKNKQWSFVLDQFLHLVMLGVVVAFQFNHWPNVLESVNGSVVLFLIAMVMLTTVSSVFIQVFMGRWKVSDDAESDSLKKAGKFIGYFERLLVFLFVVLNHWSAIGFLIAAKSVFCFSDLSRSEDRKLTEYMLIGTLLSFGLALIIALLYNYCKEIIMLG